MGPDEDLISEYAHILKEYLQKRNEADLKCLSQFGSELVDEDIDLEQILAVHFEVVRDMMKELSAVVRPRLIVLSFQCLSEVLTDYRLAVTERIKSDKVEYDQIRKHIYLLEKRSREPDPHGEKRQRAGKQN